MSILAGVRRWVRVLSAAYAGHNMLRQIQWVGGATSLLKKSLPVAQV